MNKTSKTIYFATSNTGKFEEVKRYIDTYSTSINLEIISLDIPEYQTLSIKEVAKGKAQEAFKLVKKPLIVDDGGIYLEAFNKFPGTLTKFVYQGIGLNGFWKLAKDNPKAYFLSCLVYIDDSCSYKYFEGTQHGTLVNPNTKEIVDKRLPFAEIFIPEGYTETLGELRRKNIHGQFHRESALKELITWLS